MQTETDNRLESLKENIAGIECGINEACARSGRKPSEVTIMAVTKYADAADIRRVIETGRIKIVGENKVQSVRARWIDGGLADLRRKVELHLIGHLQTNKAKTAVEIFDSIDSVDSLKTAAAINRHAAEIGKTMPVLIQIKISGAETQSGISPDEAGVLLKEAEKMKNLDVRGYMAIAPANAAEEEIFSAFSVAKALFDRDFGQSTGSGHIPVLSLGMSGDYKTAVRAGSTMVRIGGALFR